MNLDAHQHFWNYTEKEYPWIPKNTPLHRDWLPTDLAPLLKAAGLNIAWHEFMKAHTIAGEPELEVIRDFVRDCFSKT